MSSPPATVTIEEAAELLGVGRNTAYQAAATGAIVGVPVLRVGRRLLLPRAPLLAALGITPTPNAPSPTVTDDPAGGGAVREGGR